MTEEDTNETCTLCKGTGKFEGSCDSCFGTGKNIHKLNQRPILCFYCRNTGKCKRCKGTKLQKKHRIFGEEITCENCGGTGICPVCKDAPNGGYYMTFFIYEHKGTYHGQHGKEIYATYTELKRLKNQWETLNKTNPKIKSFEDFAKYPSQNYMDRKAWHDANMCPFVDSELKRYEEYLKKFE